MSKPKSQPAHNMLGPSDVEAFWGALDKWQKKLSLTHWRIVRSQKESKFMAEMTDWDGPQRQVACRIGLNWKATPVTEKTIEETAVHELLHVLLADLIDIAKSPGHADDDLKAAEHAVINTLERLLVPEK